MPKRILVVEDDPLFRNYLYQVLKYDFEVTVLGNPLEAINNLKKNGSDLLITDLRMPELDGRELVEKVHASIDPHLPVIVITAFEDDWPVDAALTKHVFTYLRKGAFLPSELKQNVEKAMEMHSALQSAQEVRKGGEADFYRAILNNSPNAFFITETNLKPVFLGKGFQRLTGFNLDRIPGTLLDIMDSATRTEVTETVSDLHPGRLEQRKMVFKRTDDTEIPVDVWLSLVNVGQYDLILGIGRPDIIPETRDIEPLKAEIKRLHEIIDQKSTELQALQERVTRIASDARGIIIWLDEKCRCVYVNSEIERILGYPAQEYIEKEIDWGGLLHPDDAHVVEDIRGAVKEGRTFMEGEARAHTRSGYMIFLAWHAAIQYQANGSLRSMDLIAEDITQCKVAEEELRKATLRIQELYGNQLQEMRDSEERYRLIVENSQEVIFSMDSDCRVIYMNNQGLKALGLTMDEVLGHPCNEFISDDFSQSKLARVLENLNTPEVVERFNLSIDTPGGKRVWNITLGNLKVGNKIEYMSVARDITEEFSNFKRLRLLANIEHYSADAIIGLDLDRRIISWNQGASMMLGWNEDEIIGKSAYAIIPDEKRREAEEVLNIIIERGFIKNLETRRLTKSGQALDVALTMTAIKDDKGGLVGFSAMIKDISEQKKMETALVQSERLAATGKLAASIAHEINNPLYGIRSCLNHVLNTEDKKQIDTQFVRLAIKETDRIAELIRNMKTFYMPTEGKILEIDVNEILREVFAFNRKYLEENRVRLEFLDGLCPLIQGVPEQLKQVFINLITNAVEAMPQGGGLTVATETAFDEKSVHVVFTDTGVGIASDDLPRIFEMFYSKKPHVKGVGLGLSVSYGIIKRHGGRIDVKSDEGQGTSFTVTLPVKTEWGRQLQLDLH